MTLFAESPQPLNLAGKYPAPVDSFYSLQFNQDTAYAMIANPGKSMNVLGQIKVPRLENNNAATGRVPINNLPISNWNGKIIAPINIHNPAATGHYTEAPFVKMRDSIDDTMAPHWARSKPARICERLPQSA